MTAYFNQTADRLYKVQEGMAGGEPDKNGKTTIFLKATESPTKGKTSKTNMSNQIDIRTYIYI
jgi:hypothetical protein